ncbi:MAG: hypothetical protein CME32_24335 [Gimesia sp.]|nr:hypothetical protein [Gimesia sp.]
MNCFKTFLAVGVTLSASFFCAADAQAGVYECFNEDDLLDCIPCVEDCWTDRVSFYISANNYASVNHMESGGFNTWAFSANSGSDNNVAYDFGLALGTRIPIGCKCKALRFEVEGAFRDLGGLTTTSFQLEGPIQTYVVDYDDRWSVMTNCWLDFPLKNNKTIYIGGGIGANGGKVSIDDTYVSGQSRFNRFAWQIGGGVTWDVSQRVTLDLGYRYMDYGSTFVDLNDNFNPNNAAGNYIADLTSHQVMLGIRFNSLGNLIGRR